MEKWPSKRSGENDFRGCDWTGHLLSGETIVDFDFQVQGDTSLSLETKSSDGAKIIGRFSGGTAGETVQVVAQITTSVTPARVLEQLFEMDIE